MDFDTRVKTLSRTVQSGYAAAKSINVPSHMMAEFLNGYADAVAGYADDYDTEYTQANCPGYVHGYNVGCAA